MDYMTMCENFLKMSAEFSKLAADICKTITPMNVNTYESNEVEDENDELQIDFRVNHECNRLTKLSYGSSCNISGIGRVTKTRVADKAAYFIGDAMMFFTLDEIRDMLYEALEK